MEVFYVPQPSMNCLASSRAVKYESILAAQPAYGEFQGEMIIFESILTTFEVSFIFWASWGSIENWLELKIEPPLANLAFLNRWNTL